jgi:hypothetical protein
MATDTYRLIRTVGAFLCASALLASAGCGGLKVVPVSGKVTIDKVPLKGGLVSFNADASKGNKANVMCVGRINSEGRYELTTNSVSETRKGAPLGWYKVTLKTTLPGEAEIKVPGKYLDFEQTPLWIEVVADPKSGAYDLELTNKRL